MIIMCACALRACSSAWLRLARTAVSSSENVALSRIRGAMLISTLNCPSSVWKSGSETSSSTCALAIAGSPVTSVRLSSISRPTERGSRSNACSASMRANTSRQRLTLSR